MAFTQNVFPTLLRMPRKGLVQILNADGTAQKTVITAGANGNKLVALIATSTDTAAQNVQVSIVRNAATFILATTAVPAGAGNAAGTSPADLLAIIPNLPRDQDSQPYLFLESGDTLVVNSGAAVTAGRVVNAHAEHAEF